MSQELSIAASGTPLAIVNSGAASIFVTVSIADQFFGIPVLQVQDVLGPQKITRVPLVPAEVLGSLNLRGRIVTAIDVRVRLGLPPRPAEISSMSIVVNHDGELYSLVVDKVGEVMSLSMADYEKNPTTLDAQWREVSDGVYRLKEYLLVILDVTRLLRLNQNGAV